MGMDGGLLLLRIVTGMLLAAHGIQKCTFRLGGAGLDGGIAEFRGDGFRGGALTALTAAGGQIAAGVLFLAGALTPLAAAIAMGVMTVAVTVKWAHGPWAPHDGYEYPGFLVVTAAALGLTGPGRWSVDDALGLLPWRTAFGIVAIVIGVGAGLLTRAVLHRAPALMRTAGGRT